MNRKSFWIPVGWTTELSSELARPVLQLHSNTWVVRTPWHGSHSGGSFEVERVPGSWSKHIPEKKPLYRVSWGDKIAPWSPRRLASRRDDSMSTSPERLHMVPIGKTIIVPLRTDRPQPCLDLNGEMHGIYRGPTCTGVFTNCGVGRVFATTASLQASLMAHEVPTCTECLKWKSVWSVFTVFDYTPKAEIQKRTVKEKSALEQRLRLPTAYARILDDDFLENPTYKPVKKRFAPVDPDALDATEDYDDPRDRKRSSSIDRSRRIEESRARIQGHRR